MSRRCFLKTSSAALAASLAGCATVKSSENASELSEYIDIQSFRPKPQVRIASIVVREKPPYWLGWPGTAYPLEEYREKYADIFAAAAQKTGASLLPDNQFIESEEDANRFVEKAKAEKPDAVLMLVQSGGAWRWRDIAAQTGLPTIIFMPVGTTFTGSVLNKTARLPGVHLISSLDTNWVEQALRMVRAKRQLEETRLLVVQGNERKESDMELLGTKVRYVPRQTFRDLFDRMPDTEEAREVAQTMRRRAQKIVEPSKQDILNAARSYMTAKRLLRDESSNALTTDCLGMVSAKAVPTPPCMAASLFQDAGVTYGCEADVFAAMSLLLVSYLFDKPGFMQDPVPDTVKNQLIAAHCACGTRLNGFDQKPEDFILRSHSESNIGVSIQTLWRKGQPVTLLRLNNPRELILDTGVVVGNVNTPPAGGCRTSVEIAMDGVEDVRDVLGFHQAVFYGNHRRDVEAFCQMYGIRVIHSPEKSTKA
ncbi:MAG: hypothetical protein AB1656_07490 [Candidatus Omnitrophota bacterium]